MNPPIVERDRVEDPRGPTTLRKVANFVVFQGAWTVAILAAAHGAPAAAAVAIAVAVAWHLAVSAAPGREARLVATVMLIGFVFEMVRLPLHDIAYASGQPVPWLPPYWLVGMWGLLAITLNVSLRWLHGRWALAALLGLVGGPLSFVAGVRLGGASFVDRDLALLTLAAGWFLLMPLLTAVAGRLDGVVVPRVGHG